jgi:cell cycle checkpoint protein
MEYPDDRDVLETFECELPVSFRCVPMSGHTTIADDTTLPSYRFSLMTRTLKALNSSTKTSLRIDDEGLLSLQFLMPSPRPKGALGPAPTAGTEAFIEFRVSRLSWTVDSI